MKEGVCSGMNKRGVCSDMNERRGVEWYDGKKGWGLVEGYDK